ncbi:MAG: hypothetical protein Q9209_005414 [Squamulea sp. 1 TL-2023]
MATGFEVLSLAIGAFPIVLEGLKHLKEGVETFKTWRSYRRELDSYSSNLIVAYIFLQDTVEYLFQDIAETEDEMRALRQDPRSLASASAHYDEQLRYLLDHMYEHYLENMRRVMDLLETLRQKLHLARDMTSWDDMPTLQRELRRIKLALSTRTYREILSGIDKANQQLRECTHHSRLLEHSRNKRQSSTISNRINLIQHGMRNLFEVLVCGDIWTCKCREQHSVNLRLEPQVWQIYRSKPALEPNFEVHVVMAADAEVRAAEHLGVLQNTSVRQIRELCATIHDKSSIDKISSLVVDGPPDLHEHHVLSVRRHNMASVGRATLNQLLNPIPQQSPGEALSWRNTLEIASALASSVLLLDGTQWLKTRWSSKDIVILRIPDVLSESIAPDDLHPYLSWNVWPQEPGRLAPDGYGSSMTMPNIVECDSLFALGVTLIELCFGKTIAELRTHEDDDTNKDEKVREGWSMYKAAHRLKKDINMYRGERFGNIVRRCLDCSFGVGVKRLDNKDFQHGMLETIVKPLQAELKDFLGAAHFS